MQLNCYNRALINDREKTYLTTAAAASAVALTVASTDMVAAGTSSNVWADNDYMIVGELGSETAEVMQMAAAVTSATSLTIDREGSAGGLRFSHPIGSPVYRIDYNQVEFSRATTITGTKTVLATVNLQPDDEVTRYDDTSSTTGYGFVRFKNSTGTTYSSYSDSVNYEESGEKSSRDPRTLWSMRKKIRQLLNEMEPDSKMTDQMVDDAINDKQREIAHIRLWSFYEGEKSYSSVQYTHAYDIPTTVNKIHGIKFETQPLRNMSKAEWDLLHYDTDSSAQDPFAYGVWNNQIWIYPRPSADAGADALNGAITATATSMIVDDSSDFTRGDYYRMIIDSEVIYATGKTSTTFTGLLRAQEGTTAAIHLNDAVITERDIVYSCHLEPTDLLDTQDRTAIPEPDVLTYGAAIDLGNYLEVEQGKLDRLEIKYKLRIKDLKDKYSSKQTLQHGRIKDMKERLPQASMYEDPNRFPSDVN